ncbi:MAG: family 16 glycosylhydrolase [Granulosicoccus sp.]
MNITTSKLPRSAPSAIRRQLAPSLLTVMFTILSACTDAGVNGSESQTNTTLTTPIASNPSLGAAQGTDNNDESDETRDNTAAPGIEAEVETKRYFESVTTPGFDGEILDDAIKISWPEDPNARGYNVYRQAEYYTTVFDTEFVDTDVFNDSYYYEIQAFDYDDNFSYLATGLTVVAQTFGRIDPDAPKPDADLLKDYEVVFSDEFNSMELDTSKWNTSFLWGSDLFINQEEQYYVDVANDPDFGFNPFTFDGEHMTINTIETPTELLADAMNQPYLSGIITSYDAFKFTYGYTETRAKFTHGRGYWPAFWLLNAYYVDAKPEIDIMEFIGDNQDVVFHTYHYFDGSGDLRSTESFPVAGIDFTEDFHTFGVEWMPGTLIFYVDGVETHKVVDINVSQQEMYVIANQAVGGWWAGSPDSTTPLPGEYIIDYIRIYQRTTPYKIVEFDQQTDVIPLFTDNPGRVLPNKRPMPSVWPAGYPDGQ